MNYSNVLLSHERAIRRLAGQKALDRCNFGWADDGESITSKTYPGTVTTYYDPDTFYILGHEAQ